MQQDDSDDIIEQQAKMAEAKFKKKKAPLLVGGRAVILTLNHQAEKGQKFDSADYYKKKA